MNNLCAFALVMVVAAHASCQNSGSQPQRPLHQIEWTGMKSFGEWGQTSDGLFGLSEHRLQTWTWDRESMRRVIDAQVATMLKFAHLSGGAYLACVRPNEEGTGWPLILAHVSSGEIIEKWEPPPKWYYHHTGSSSDGGYAVVILGQQSGYHPKGEQRRIGIMEASSPEIRWVAELNGEVNGAIRQIIASGDGKYIAVAGWHNGTAVVDTSLEKVLWAARPATAVSISHASFSPDGETLFLGDSGGGGVYVVETRTGKVLQQRYATESGKAIYGHRITSFAASPDGAWLAAGTGPEGQVFLFDVREPESSPIMLPHGFGSTLILSFSPDSSHLASVAGGIIKIWAVPNTKTAETQPSLEVQTRPAESQASG